MSENKVDVAELLGLLEKATERPWEYEPDAPRNMLASIFGPYDGDADDHGRSMVTRDRVCFLEDNRYQEENADLIVAAVNNLGPLLDQLEQAQRDEGELTQGLRERGLHLPSEGLFKGALASLDEWMGYAGAEKTRAEASESRVAELTADLSASEKELATLRLTVGRQGGHIVELTAEVEDVRNEARADAYTASRLKPLSCGSEERWSRSGEPSRSPTHTATSRAGFRSCAGSSAPKTSISPAKLSKGNSHAN